jgi:peptidyl-prolyl cis-trans isomerase SurA
MLLIKTISKFLKNNMFKNKIATLLLIPFSLCVLGQQNQMVDKIVAVVGGSIVLQSDIEQQILQLRTQRIPFEKCEIFENFLVQKLLVNQAKVDSIDVSDANVELQLNNRIDYFIEQAGSKEKLEEYYNRSLFQIKEDMRVPLKEQMVMQRMQSEITGNTKITPSEVSEFFNSLAPDSIPLVNTQIEYKQIVVNPPFAEKSIYDVKKKLLDLRKRILDGEKFSTLAVLYSEDPGSAKSGGEIGFMSKGELDPEYAKVAFGLKQNAVSGIVESEFGFHLIQMIARDGDRVNTRHILMKPRPTEVEIKAALSRLDSVVNFIKSDSLTFEKAAIYYSDDKNSKLANGQVVNPNNNSTKFEIDQLPQEDYYIIKKLNVGEMSEPFPGKDEGKKDVYKVIKLISKTEPHRANLKDDYQLVQDIALENKKKIILGQWIENKLSTTYTRIDQSYSNCTFKNKGWMKK